jgi:hypothetical protein
MSTLPNGDLNQITFMEQHAPIWAASPTAVGLTAATCTQITSAVGAARKAFNDAQNARAASKSFTNTQKNAIAAMHTLSADAIKTIRLFAETSGNPEVYSKADIDPPAPPTPAQAPTQPIQLRASIEPSGALTIGWKAGPASTNPITGQVYDPSTVGVTYVIGRKVNGEMNFTQVGTAEPARSGPRGFASFTDATLVAGSSNIQYMITPRRGALIGPMSEVFSVTLGVGGGGMFVSGTASAPLKMAA